jgi:hypothetical protein
MEKFYTEKSKKSEIEKITHLIDVVATAPGNVINYLDARAIIHILADRREDLEKELHEVCHIENDNDNSWITNPPMEFYGM